MNIGGFANALSGRADLQAPGVSKEPSDKDRAILLARQAVRADVVLSPADAKLLSEQFLRALALTP